MLFKFFLPIFIGYLLSGLINVNPATGVKPPVESVDPATRINYLELEEVKLLLALTEGDTLKLQRDRLIVGLMMLHGLRTVEVQKLNLGHIKVQGKTKSIIVTSKRSPSASLRETAEAYQIKD